jgi:hypothetical protein
MGSTTTNFAIPYPAVTDFVTDGAQNMEDIAERVDAVLGAVTGGRNRLINGDFRVAQRGTSFVAGANNDDTYNLDRWTLLSDGNDIVDVTQANVAPTGGLFSIGLDVETANKKFGILQIIEQRNIIGCYGQQCTLSFKFRTSGSSINNVKAAILSWTGTADTVTSDVVSAWNADNTIPTWATNWTAENTPANLNPSNSWQTATITALVDTASVNNIAVFIWCDDLTTTIGDFLYVTDVQFEVGETGSTFERRQMQQELALCQRYYQRLGNANLGIWGTGYTPTFSQYVSVYLAYRVNTRTTSPTITKVGTWGGVSTNFIGITDSGVTIYHGGSASAGFWEFYTLSASTYVEVSNEL